VPSIKLANLGKYFFRSSSFCIFCIYFPPNISDIQWLSEGLSSGINRPEREADHLPVSTAKFKTEWSHTPSRTFAFMACRATNIFYFNFPLLCTVYVSSSKLEGVVSGVQKV